MLFFIALLCYMFEMKHEAYVNVNGKGYIVYKRNSERELPLKFKCLTEDIRKEGNLLSHKSTNKDADDLVLRSYLFALSVTAEYTEYHFGGTVGIGQDAAAKAAALSAMNATLTRVNGIFERDFLEGSRVIFANPIIYFQCSTGLSPSKSHTNTTHPTLNIDRTMASTGQH